MATNELVAVAILAVNIWAATSGAMAARAWWPRHSLRGAPRSTRVFYYSIIGLMIAFAANAGLRAIHLCATWPPTLTIASLDDLIWRSLGSLACIGMVYAKLLALPPPERARWNILTIVWHPNPDLLVVRMRNAFTRRMRRRKEIDQ